LFTLANLSRVALTEGKSVGEAPLRLVVEDDYPLQGVVEDFLRQGGFDAHILSSGEEALTLFRAESPNTRRSSPT
jgi:ActR/RegA family two-component response regulator